MADAENPFAKYAKKPSPSSTPDAENPFAKYAKKPSPASTPDAENPFAKYVKTPSPASASDAENPFAKYAKKPTKPETPMFFIGDGMPVSFDPEEQKQIARGQLEFMKGMAAGVGEVPVGIAQAASDLAKKVVPQGWADYLKGLDEKLVGAEKYLESTGPEGAAGKVSRGAGGMVAMAAPGGVIAKGVGKGMEALGMAPQALAEGAGFGARLVERGKSLASGLLGGGATGAGTAALQPSTKLNPEERAKEREINMLEGAAAGGVLGAAPPLVKGVTDAAKSFGNVVERAKGAKAAEKIEQLRGDVTQIGERLKSQEQRAAGETFKRQAENETQAEQNARLAREVVEQHAARPSVDEVTFGETAMPRIENYETKYRKIRADESGYSEMMARAHENPKPVIPTKEIVDRIDEIIPEGQPSTLNNPGAESALAWIRSRLANPENKITLEQADSMRKTLNQIISSGEATLDTGMKAAVGDKVHLLEDIQRKLRAATENAVPEYGSVLEKYQKLSRPLDAFRRKGALYGVTKRDPFSNQYNMKPGDAARKIVQAVKSGDDVLARVVAEDPEIKNAARLYMNEEIKRLGKDAAAEKFDKFMAENRRFLEQTGLKDEFATLQKARRTGAMAEQRAEAASKDAEKAASALENHKKALAEFDKLERWFKDEPDANKVANEARNFVDKQAARGAITPEDAAAIADRIREAVALNTDAGKAKAAVMSVLKVALAVGSMVAVGGTGGYIARMAGGAAMGGGH